AGADGVCVNARTWASAAKAGMKQAAAPQEKARPSILQQIVTINRAKAAHNFPNKVPPYRAAAPMCRGPRPRYPNRFAGRGYNPAHQHFVAQAYRASCPTGFRCPRFPFQQGPVGGQYKTLIRDFITDSCICSIELSCFARQQARNCEKARGNRSKHSNV
ncbi:hypothetical protein KUCAC02_010967, partial [Chaenocephalus aceratus]